MKRSRLAWLALAAPIALAAGSPPAEDERFQVRVAEIDGEWRCSVIAERAPVQPLVAALARHCGVALEGFNGVARTTLVDVELRDRPVRQALDYVLGSVGLRVEPRTGAWLVCAGVRAPSTPEKLREQALSAYLGVLREFPDLALCAEALWNQALVEIARSEVRAARVVLDGLVERHPHSPLVPAALMRAGELCEREQDWDQAAVRFADLLRLARPHEHEIPARLELALCAVHQGRSDRALAMLATLERIAPSADPTQAQARSLVRAMAHVEAGSFAEAQHDLDVVESTPLSEADRAAALELRARSFEGLGNHAEAARAWLAVGRGAQGAEQTIALRHAARLALEAGDELAVLMIHALAQDSGAEGATEALARAARERLALAPAARAGAAAVERLERAEELLARGLTGEAAAALDALDMLRAELDQEQTARFTLANGRALAASAGLDAALAAFRELLPELEGAQHRRAVYLLAGELLEEAGRMDEAIEAYRGRM